LSGSGEGNRDERAVPSSSSVSANLGCVGEDNGGVEGLVVGVEDNPEVSSSRSVANNVVDAPVSNGGVGVAIAVEGRVRRSSVSLGIDFKIRGIDRGVDGELEVSSVKRDRDFEDGEAGISSINREARGVSRDGVVGLRALRVRVRRHVIRKSNRSNGASGVDGGS